MAGFFRHPDRRQLYLLPVDMMDWLPQDDIVHLIVDAVATMDLRRFEEAYRVGGVGQPPYAPAMMLAVLIYAYSSRIRSSRKIEQLCRRDAGFRFLGGDVVPDHCAIARFRRRHGADMQALFGALRYNQDATNAFLSAITGAIPLPDFMSSENIGRIMAAANEAEISSAKTI